MGSIQAGTRAPAIRGLAMGEGKPRLLFFYKIDCPVCQMTAPKAEALHTAYPGAVVGVGEDPPDSLDAFARDYAMSFVSVPDLAPYEASNAYGIAAVPTLVLVDGGGGVVDVAESWSREAWNRISRRLAELTGSPYTEVSSEGDGLPSFRPG